MFAEAPHTTRNPGLGALRHASNSRAPSSGDSQVARPRTPGGSGKQEPIRMHTTSSPNRSWYRLPSASIAALLTP
ncbi:hypothetical protein Asera_54700 [Actinocatenispora sera]|uniref:Uncharacterized protein n=1 Tax=Actinocatenispora sera TaxID=390989 RepID=A0A810L9U0_9ACTN|nr:hypothetical protein Asera_54700 [Actinocatenispora sera]